MSASVAPPSRERSISTEDSATNGGTVTGSGTGSGTESGTSSGSVAANEEFKNDQTNNNNLSYLADMTGGQAMNVNDLTPLNDETEFSMSMAGGSPLRRYSILYDNGSEYASIPNGSIMAPFTRENTPLPAFINSVSNMETATFNPNYDANTIINNMGNNMGNDGNGANNGSNNNNGYFLSNDVLQCYEMQQQYMQMQQMMTQAQMQSQQYMVLPTIDFNGAAMIAAANYGNNNNNNNNSNFNNNNGNGNFNNQMFEAPFLPNVTNNSNIGNNNNDNGGNNGGLRVFGLAPIVTDARQLNDNNNNNNFNYNTTSNEDENSIKTSEITVSQATPSPCSPIHMNNFNNNNNNNNFNNINMNMNVNYNGESSHRRNGVSYQSNGNNFNGFYNNNNNNHLRIGEMNVRYDCGTPMSPDTPASAISPLSPAVGHTKLVKISTPPAIGFRGNNGNNNNNNNNYNNNNRRGKTGHVGIKTQRFGKHARFGNNNNNNRNERNNNNNNNNNNEVSYNAHDRMNNMVSKEQASIDILQGRNAGERQLNYNHKRHMQSAVYGQRSFSDQNTANYNASYLQKRNYRHKKLPPRCVDKVQPKNVSYNNNNGYNNDYNNDYNNNNSNHGNYGLQTICENDIDGQTSESRSVTQTPLTSNTMNTTSTLSTLSTYASNSRVSRKPSRKVGGIGGRSGVKSKMSKMNRVNKGNKGNNNNMGKMRNKRYNNNNNYYNINNGYFKTENERKDAIKCLNFHEKDDKWFYDKNSDKCENFFLYGVCEFGGKCNKSHLNDHFDGRTRVSNYKCQPCSDECSGMKCAHQTRCNFAHSGEALRRPANREYNDIEYFKLLVRDFPKYRYPFGMPI